jgi:DNA polymerase III delta prime subunit
MAYEYLWVEKYAPQTVEECILPDGLKQYFIDIRDSQKIPNMILSGARGIGKTSVIFSLAKELDRDLMIINGSDERTIDVIRNKVKNYASTISLNPGKKILLIDEGDNLTNDAQLALRGCIEEFQKNCSFVFTCNNINGIHEAIQSRCPPITFVIPANERKKLMAQLFKRVIDILQQENVKCEDNNILVKFIARHFPDFRKTIHLLESYSKSGVIRSNILSQVSDVNITLLYKLLKEKKFVDVRKWIVDNMDNDPNILLRRVYDGLDDVMDKPSIPAAILTIHDHMNTNVVDNEINLLACFIKLMVDCEWL